jgi:hypothetical protein
MKKTPMKKHWPQFAAFLIFTLGALRAGAGTVFYVPIPPSESDPNSGISSENTYTTAIDGGNAQGTDRVINGITLYTMTGEGQSVSANSCSLTVLDGTVANGGGAAESIKADGTLSQVVSDMTFNNEANDGSEQEIVLDPESLTAGTTYDLRVYISNSSGQNREVNLKFFGDGQPPAETGWFNEDDATTSPGGFKDPNQVYYIDYRYTWDGDTTPGITISQRYGRTPFCLYGLTNQVVPGEELGTTAAGAEAEAEAAPAESGGLSAGFTAASADDVGVTSDTFYSDDTLNSNGEWVDVGGYGKCWRPTKVSADWRPYTNGRWGNCDDCGWTWISDDDWGWCTDHYGRWTHTEDTGWCWAPGTVWSPAWVSWRRGTGPDCSCIGWAPLPPEAGCEIDVGIGNWVDYTCGLGPDAYTFVNVVDFGTDNFSRCGTCLIDRGRYVNIFEQTTNITNISYVNIVNQTNQKYVNIYNGGPDPNWCNTEIRKHGGKEIPQIHVNRYDDPAKIKGGKRSQLEGNTLSVAAPKITPTKNPQHAPKVAATIPREKVDKGWGGIKDPKVKANLQNKIAQETKGKTPRNAPAKLPREVASKLAQKPITTGQVKGLPKGAVVQQPGARGGAATQARARPGRPGESRQKGLAGQPGAPGRPGTGASDPTKGLAAPPKTQGRHAEKPGKPVGQQGRATAPGKAGAATQGGAPGTAQGVARQGGVRPGQSLKKTGRGQAGLDAQKKEGPQGAKQGAQVQSFQPGKQGIQGKGQGVQQGQAQKGSQGGRPSVGAGSPQLGRAGQSTAEQKGRGIQQGKAQRPGVTEAPAGAQGATQPRETKPGQTAQKKEQAARKQEQQRQLQQPQAGQGGKPAQQAGAQQQQAHQQQAVQQQKQRQQQQAQQQQAAQPQKQRQQQQAQQQQAAQPQKQRQQQQAQQQQAAQPQKQRQQQQAQQQQAQQQQRQLQQQQAQQQQRQLQQQQAQQQQQRQGGKKGKQTPTPPPY